MSKFWKLLAITEGIMLLTGLALIFVYFDYRAGNLPYSVKDVLSLIASVALLGGLFGGFVGWVMILSIVLEKRK